MQKSAITSVYCQTRAFLKYTAVDRNSSINFVPLKILVSSRQLCHNRHFTTTRHANIKYRPKINLIPKINLKFFSSSRNSFKKSLDKSVSDCDENELHETRGNIVEEARDVKIASQSIGKLQGGRLRIVFTCKVCRTRSEKTFWKTSYEKGVVIVECPGCKNNHLIADNLGWFNDVKGRNIEEILSHKGENVKRIKNNSGVLELHEPTPGVSSGNDVPG